MADRDAGLHCSMVAPVWLPAKFTGMKANCINSQETGVRYPLRPTRTFVQRLEDSTVVVSGLGTEELPDVRRHGRDADYCLV